MLKRHLVIGTRRSRLARWQTDHVIALLKHAHPSLTTEIKVISTRGDEILDKPLPAIGGKGLFTEALESALLNREIDLAVHSLKDLPTENPQGLTVGAIPKRADPHDALISRERHTLSTLPENAVIGTSSRRRAAQLLHYRPDLRTTDIRGNVPTRINKAHESSNGYTAIILAHAGVTRLGLQEHIIEDIPYTVMLPAPGQGALGIQCRDEAESLALLAPIADNSTALAVNAERAFLAGLGGGCSVPVAAHATITNDTLQLTGRVIAVDGSRLIEVESNVSLTSESESDQAYMLGQALAEQALKQGANVILESIQ